jgi:hypothetical protein
MRLAAYISQTSAEATRPSLSVYHVIADWDWRIARLLSVFAYLAAAWTQFDWSHSALLQSIAFYYSLAAVACLVMAVVYFYLCAYEVQTWSVGEHRNRFTIQFLSCLLWAWTMFLDGYSQWIDAVATDWTHHWEINVIVMLFLGGSCLNELVATSRAMAYEDLGEADE